MARSQFFPMQPAKLTPAATHSHICGLCTPYFWRGGKPVEGMRWAWGNFKQLWWTQACRQYSQKHSLVLQFCSQQSQCNWKIPARAKAPGTSILQIPAATSTSAVPWSTGTGSLREGCRWRRGRWRMGAVGLRLHSSFWGSLLRYCCESGSLALPTLPASPPMMNFAVLPPRVHLTYECWIYMWVTNTSFYALLKTRSIITKVNI